MSQPSDYRITLRLKPDEHALLAEKAGGRALSPFIRQLALDQAAQRRTRRQAAPVRDYRALAQVLALLGQHELVRAFRDVARQVEDGLVPADEDVKDQLAAIERRLERMHSLLMRALGVAAR